MLDYVLKRGERLEKPENKACHDDLLVLRNNYDCFL